MTVTTPAGRRILGLTVSALSAPPAPLLVVFQDLTDLRRAEQELRRADRLAELGALSAQLAHEIRNPLAAMRGSAQLLSPGADPDTERLVDILTREADRLGELVDRLPRLRPAAGAGAADLRPGRAGRGRPSSCSPPIRSPRG